jgi:hypothetical protein
MDINKLSNGGKIVGVAGIVLIINLFLPWYGAFGFSLNAFDAEFLAWGGSFFAIAGAVVLVLKQLEITDLKAGQFSAEQLALLLGAIGAVLVILRWITETDLVKFGVYLGIIAAVGVAAGSFMALRESGQDIPFQGMGGGGGDEPPPPPPPA